MHRLRSWRVTPSPCQVSTQWRTEEEYGFLPLIPAVEPTKSLFSSQIPKPLGDGQDDKTTLRFLINSLYHIWVLLSRFCTVFLQVSRHVRPSAKYPWIYKRKQNSLDILPLL